MPTRRTNTHAVAVRPASYGHGTILANAADEARKSTQGRSHPSVQQAAEVMGATFQEVQGLAALERAMHTGTWRMLAITPLTPSMYHLPVADVAAAVDIARAAHAVIFVDDAHMMSRSV